jgi:two-component system NtrC family response regulator
VRVVAATHRDLKQLITQGRFREDLYYRLAEITLEVPPLRQRTEDVPMLAREFTRRFSAANGRPRLKLSAAAMEAICAHRWPGNVRELENAIKGACALADGDGIEAGALGLAPPDERESFDLRTLREDFERKTVARAMARVDGNIVKAAELLGVSRPTLYDLLNKLGLR